MVSYVTFTNMLSHKMLSFMIISAIFGVIGCAPSNEGKRVHMKNNTFYLQGEKELTRIKSYSEFHMNRETQSTSKRVFFLPYIFSFIFPVCFKKII